LATLKGLRPSKTVAPGLAEDELALGDLHLDLFAEVAQFNECFGNPHAAAVSHPNEW
jgi:hypothetical protein